jgi:hypothetical protein
MRFFGGLVGVSSSSSSSASLGKSKGQIFHDLGLQIKANSVALVSLSAFLFLSFRFYMLSLKCDEDPEELVRRWMARQQGVQRLVPYSRDEGVVFLKTHKTASSTVTSLIWHELCEKEGRKCFLPPLEYPGKTWDFRKEKDWEMMPKRRAVTKGTSNYSSGFPFEVWTSHAAYTPALSTVVRQSGRMISIVRQSSSRFESAWHWYNHSKLARMSLSEFADATKDEREAVASQMKYRSGLDATTEELTGITKFRSQPPGTRCAAFDELLDRVASKRLILLVAERFDESLLVLGKLMNWNPHQLSHFHHKVGNYTHVGASVRAKLEVLQPFDSALWKFADFMLNRFLEDFPLVQHDLVLVSKANSRLATLCEKDPTTCECGKLRDNNEAVKDTWLKGRRKCEF